MISEASLLTSGTLYAQLSKLSNSKSAVSLSGSGKLVNLSHTHLYSVVEVLFFLSFVFYHSNSS